MTDTTFPSITFPATFEGAGSIGADFSTVLKFKPSDALRVLADLKALPRGTYDVTVVAHQSRLAGDSLDREWASMELQEDAQDAGELSFGAHCLGGRCPHFAVATSGELEGSYICWLDLEEPFAVEHEVTACPLGVDDLADAEEAIEDAGGVDDETLSGEGSTVATVVIALYPGDEEPHPTNVGEQTRYAELVADYLTAAGLTDEREIGDFDVTGEDDGEQRVLSDLIMADDHGKRLVVSEA